MGGRVSFDFRQVEKLQKQLEQLERERNAFCEACAKNLAERLLRKVAKRTPVGRAPKLEGPKAVKVNGVSGKSRAMLTKTGAIFVQYWSGYQGGTLRRKWSIGDIRKTGDSFVIEVINPVKYASYVEYGHRQTPGRYVPALGKKLKAGWVKGQFMMTVSERELQTQAPGIIEKRLTDFLKGVFDV